MDHLLKADAVVQQQVYRRVASDLQAAGADKLDRPAGVVEAAIDHAAQMPQQGPQHAAVLLIARQPILGERCLIEQGRKS